MNSEPATATILASNERPHLDEPARVLFAELERATHDGVGIRSYRTSDAGCL